MTSLIKKVNLIKYDKSKSINIPSIKQKKKENPWLSQKKAEKSREKSHFKKNEKREKKIGRLSMALKKRNRLGSKNDIGIIFKKGKTLNSEFFRIKYLFNDEGSNKFGISVSSKVFKRAVERNLVRRRLGEIIRKNLSRIKPNLKTMIMVKKNILTQDKRKIEEALLEELARARR